MWIVWSISTLVGVSLILSMVEGPPQFAADHRGKVGPDVLRAGGPHRQVTSALAQRIRRNSRKSLQAFG
jgi:hypothetical protein